MTYALDLNDAGLLLARAGNDGRAEVLDESPGFALLDHDRVLTGAQAYAKWRLRPRFANNRYFVDLSTQPLPRAVANVTTTADLAFTHLSELLRAHGQGDELLLAVPAGYSREQLALLLGILGECQVAVTGVVDSALAASTDAETPPRSAHLDLQLHRAVLTVFDHDRQSALARTHFEINPRVGLMPLQQAAMQVVSDVFVRKTRFDPMYEAQHEQTLADRLPTVLEALQSDESFEYNMEARSTTYNVDLQRSELLNSLGRHYTEIVQLVQGALRAQEVLPLAISHRLTRWPGLQQQLEAIPQLQVRVLPAEAAALGALRHLNAIRRGPETLALVTRLPAALAAQTAPAQVRPQAVPRELLPTHVLYSGRAYSISQAPLTIGWSVGEGRRAVPLPSGVPGLSRAHCTLVRRDGVVLIEDHSTYGSFINDARVQGSSVLRLGDRLRLGAPGVTLDLIQLVQDDGAPTEV